MEFSYHWSVLYSPFNTENVSFSLCYTLPFAYKRQFESSSNSRAAVLSQTLVYRCDRIDGYLPSGMLFLARSIPFTATQFAFRAESIMCADFLVECTCLSKFSIWRWIDANLNFQIAKEQQIWTLFYQMTENDPFRQLDSWRRCEKKIWGHSLEDYVERQLTVSSEFFFRIRIRKLFRIHVGNGGRSLYFVHKHRDFRHLRGGLQFALWLVI